MKTRLITSVHVFSKTGDGRNGESAGLTNERRTHHARRSKLRRPAGRSIKSIICKSLDRAPKRASRIHTQSDIAEVRDISSSPLRRRAVPRSAAAASVGANRLIFPGANFTFVRPRAFESFGTVAAASLDECLSR